MPVTTIAGHREVDVEKDTTHCKWLIKAPQKDVVLYEVSWRYAFEWQAVSDEYFACIYTAMYYQPLSNADLEALFGKFPDLRFKELLEVERDEPVAVQSNTAPSRLPVEKKPPKEISYKRKIDL